MTTFTLTGTFTHQNGITPISKSPIHVQADPFPLGSTVQTDRVEKATDANGTVTFTLTTGVTGLYYVVRSTAKRPLFKPIRFLAPAAGTVLNINTLIFYNPGDPPLEQDLVAIRDAAIQAETAAVASVASVKIGTWQATTAYVASQTVQAPDGTLIKRLTSGTSRASFDTTEQALWKPLNASYLVADTTGATDIGPALQAAFDLSRKVQLVPGGTYLLNTPIFLDSTDNKAKYTLDLNGATLLLGASLPKASTFVADAAATWAFWPGQKRGTITTGTVAVTTGNRSTGTANPSRGFFTLRNGTVDGQNNNVGISYGNCAPVLHQNITAYRLKRGASWFDYTDGNEFKTIHVTAQPTGGFYVAQEALGDSTGLRDFKGTGGFGSFTSTRGVLIENAVGGGFTFKSSIARIVNSHVEEDDTSSGVAQPVHVVVDCSDVTIEGGYFGLGKGTSNWVVQINDQADTYKASRVTLRGCLVAYYFRTSDVDPSRDPLIFSSQFNLNGRVRFEDVRTVLWNQADNAPPRSSEGIWMDATSGGIKTALATGADILATGNAELRRDGAAAAWAVKTLASAGAATITRNKPTSFAAVADTSGVKGSLVNATSYSYAANIKSSAAGTYAGAGSPTATVTAGANGTVGLSFINGASDGAIIALWRKTGAGAYDHYIEVPVRDYQAYWYDTGANLNGRAWATTSIPAVP